MELGNPTSYMLIYLVAVLVIFLIGREIACWYFKINKTIAVLEKIRDLLKYPPQVANVESKIEPNLGGISEIKKKIHLLGIKIWTIDNLRGF